MVEVLIFTAASLQQEKHVKGVHRMEEHLHARYLKGASFWLVHTPPDPGCLCYLCMAFCKHINLLCPIL